jgi:hypothetical protein
VTGETPKHHPELRLAAGKSGEHLVWSYQSALPLWHKKGDTALGSIKSKLNCHSDDSQHELTAFHAFLLKLKLAQLSI